MVAPIRAPQARGVKCDLCKKLLSLATWLDQTKLAKSAKEAFNVLDLVKQHNVTGCLCMPKNIENLLVGSTYFEIHRTVSNTLDSMIHKSHQEYFMELKKDSNNGLKKNKNENINDCPDTRTTSRFKLYSGYKDQKYDESFVSQLKHLTHAIDYWKLAMEDQASPFNSKLALRLGLTHHVIYACYLFKFHKMLDYQLISANLVLNLFKSIEGVTASAVLHAHFLLIKSLIDNDQIPQARQCLKSAMKIPNYKEKTHYESILLTCVACELSLLDKNNVITPLDELTSLSIIQKDDKLQHYYARTLAISIIIKYIHHYPARSELCFEFFHIFRFIGAIIRRCYESSFELILTEKDSKQSTSAESQVNPIMNHSWIRFASCDFVFSSFDLLSSFFIRTGLPESLELLYNGLSLIAHRTGSFYWQARIASIGASLDTICDNYDFASEKLDAISHITGRSNHSYLINLGRLELEVGLLALLDRKETVMKDEVLVVLLQRLKECHSSLIERASQLELYEASSDTFSKLSNHSDTNVLFINSTNSLGHISFKAIKLTVSFMIRNGNYVGAKDILLQLSFQMKSIKNEVIEFNEYQTILEILLYFTEIGRSEMFLLDTIRGSELFLETEANSLDNVESQLSLLSISGRKIKGNINNRYKELARSTTKASQSPTCRRSRRRGVYKVAEVSKENLQVDENIKKLYSLEEALENFDNLSQEEIIICYLKCSEPNPDYLLYRQAHELLFSFLIQNGNSDPDELLFHFCESATSNTMRYRWMLYEEQQVSPYELSRFAEQLNSHDLKHLGFCEVLKEPRKTLKTFLKNIGENQRLVQIKCIVDRRLLNEHLLCVIFNKEGNPVYVNARRTIVPDDFVQVNDNDPEHLNSLTLPQKLLTKITEAKKTLFYNSYRNRSEARQKIDTDIGVILHDIENEWLGPFRFLLCGSITDRSYNKFVDKLVNEILTITNDQKCLSKAALQLVIENAPLLNRQEFCYLMSTLFSGSSNAGNRDCFNKWQKSIESLVNEKASSLNKLTFLQTLEREQLGLILDKSSEHIPLESLPIARIIKQGMFRVPSLRLYSIIASRFNEELNIDETVYILDPASNLEKTRERFEGKLRARKEWVGSISQAPKAEQLEQWFKTKEIYIYIGHGAGTSYYKNLCKGRGLSALPNIKPLPIVMGCSSGRVLSEGPRLESFGIGWVFIFRGASSYVGLLWDVTDTDIDRFLDTLLGKWMGDRWKVSNKTFTTKENTSIAITDAVSQARHVCQAKFLIGSTPVIYGLPVRCKSESIQTNKKN